MFTGIVAATGTVLELETFTDSTGRVESALLSIEAGPLIEDLDRGGSLAVNGVCLTATDRLDAPGGIFLADVMGETLRRTNLGELRAGQAVNLERCMPADGRFDGHLVLGHIDGLGVVLSTVDHGSWRTLRLSLPRQLASLVAEKGSITVSGVSLTVTAVSEPGAGWPWFEVGLIPATLAATSLGSLKVGDSVNLEVDTLARYTQRLLECNGSRSQTAPAGVGRGPGEAVLGGVDKAIEQLAGGGAVVVLDDENRENEGDLVFAAEYATDELMGFTIRHTSGVVCAPMTGERADELGLAPMVEDNQDAKGTAYTVSCDARWGVDTGISASDRARTVRLLAQGTTRATDLTRPGHIFPLRASDGGVRLRPGHTEAAVELTRLAGLSGVGVIAELVDDRGQMMRYDSLQAFARHHGLPLIRIADLITYLEQDRG